MCTNEKDFKGNCGEKAKKVQKSDVQKIWLVYYILNYDNIKLWLKNIKVGFYSSNLDCK